MKDIAKLLDTQSSRYDKFAHAIAANATNTTRGLEILEKPALKEHILATVVETLPNGIKRFCYIDNEGVVVGWTYGNDFKVIGEKIEL